MNTPEFQITSMFQIVIYIDDRYLFKVDKKKEGFYLLFLIKGTNYFLNYTQKNQFLTSFKTILASLPGLEPGVFRMKT